MLIEYSDLSQKFSQVLSMVSERCRKPKNKVFSVNTLGQAINPEVGVSLPSAGHRPEEPLVGLLDNFGLLPPTGVRPEGSLIISSDNFGLLNETNMAQAAESEADV